jgi:NAD(P)-dependent dehydrogenase (short-subunit alcohol dehydrogenase family)
VQGKRVIVTGGAQGIGKAVSRAFLKRGALVSPWDVDREALEELESEWSEYREHLLPLQVDVGLEEPVARGAEEIARRWSGVDILINNAGVFLQKPLEMLTLAEWDRVLAVDLRSIFLMVRAFSPLFSENAAIINIASTRALMSEPHTEAYSAAKGGVLSLTHALAISLAPRKIRVNAISPGWIEVSGWKKKSLRREPELRPIDHLQHPAGRVGRPEDIAAACLFLASEEAGFITGANLVVDGGMTVKMIYAE